MLKLTCCTIFFKSLVKEARVVQNWHQPYTLLLELFSSFRDQVRQHHLQKGQFLTIFRSCLTTCSGILIRHLSASHLVRCWLLTVLDHLLQGAPSSSGSAASAAPGQKVPLFPSPLQHYSIVSISFNLSMNNNDRKLALQLPTVRLLLLLLFDDQTLFLFPRHVIKERHLGGMQLTMHFTCMRYCTDRFNRFIQLQIDQ